MLWGADKKLGTVIRKNLAGHRPRNRKTAYMVSIFVAFVIFAGTMFTLQTDSISSSVELFLGADIIGFSPFVDLPLPQEDMQEYLEGAKQPSAAGPPLISDYTFVTFPIPNVKPANRTRFTNLVAVPNARGTPFGVQSNYLDVRAVLWVPARWASHAWHRARLALRCLICVGWRRCTARSRMTSSRWSARACPFQALSAVASTRTTSSRR